MTLETTIVDTHLHLWDPGRIRYDWLDDVPQLNRPYLLCDYDMSCGVCSHLVEQMVFVQCEANPDEYLDELSFAESQAGNDDRISGIVSWAPLEKGDGVRAELQVLSLNPLVRGIRRIIQFESDPSWCLQEGFVTGVQALADYNLTFDLCIKGVMQTANVLELVRQCPNVEFVLDHIGKPYIKERRTEPWATHIQRFAEFENVWCKVSGMLVEADCKKWSSDDLTPYFRHVLNCFGYSRVMFGGDWPVVLQAAPLSTWIKIVDEATGKASREERRKLFQENAKQFYRLT